MRIVAGEWKGRRLRVAAGPRPTADRVREALFSILGGHIEGIFIDLFSGTGAVGLEARSRGATAVLVERDDLALAALKSNVAELGATSGVQVVGTDVLRFLKRTDDWPAALREAGSGADVVFADPPYDYPAHPKLARLLGTTALVGEATVIVIEHRRGRPPWGHLPDTLVVTRTETYGETSLSFLRRASSADRASEMARNTAESPSTSSASDSD